jgi:hypothetical protein
MNKAPADGHGGRKRGVWGTALSRNSTIRLRTRHDRVFQRVGIPLPFAFTRAQLLPNSISLAIDGDDQWVPSSLFMFGLDSHSFANRPVSQVVPLVHLPLWNLGELSTDPNEGRSEVVLPLVPLLPL